MRNVAALFAFVVLAGCEGEKVPGVPKQWVSEATATKARAAAARVAQTETALVRGDLARGMGGLVVGQATSGALGSEDPVFDNGAHFDAWVARSRRAIRGSPTALRTSKSGRSRAVRVMK